MIPCSSIDHSTFAPYSATDSKCSLPPGTNTYLLGTGPSRILIDTGEGYPLWRTSLASTLHSEKATISHALLTHWHYDHVSGVADLLSLCPDARVYKHTPDRSKGQLGIDDGDSFEVEGAKVKGWWCPGHTEDHVCFVIENDGEAAGGGGSMFTGDSVLGHGTAVFENLENYMSSLGRMRDICRGGTGERSELKGVHVVSRGYPGHGAVVEDCGARIDEYIRHRRQREEEVFQTLMGAGVEKEGLTPLEIVRIVYKAYPTTLHEPAKGGVVKILNELKREGRVTEGEKERWRAVVEGKEKYSSPVL